MNRPIYEYIKEQLTAEGTLPDNFILPEYSVYNPRDNMFANGAQDGILSYHFGGSADNDIAEIQQALLAYTESPDETVSRVEAALENKTVLHIIDRLFSWITGERKLEPQQVYEIAEKLVYTSIRSKAVKLGILLFELFNTEGDEKTEQMLYAFSACDEFSLYCCYAYRSYSDKNERIFSVAKRTNGWGRIFAVDRFLEPSTDEIKNWLLEEGCNNAILPDYLAYTITEMTDLENRLCSCSSERFTDAQADGLAAIVTGLISEGPCTGISAIEEPESFLIQAKKQLEGRSGEITENALKMIDDYFNDDKDEE